MVKLDLVISIEWIEPSCSSPMGDVLTSDAREAMKATREVRRTMSEDMDVQVGFEIVIIEEL